MTHDHTLMLTTARRGGRCVVVSPALVELAAPANLAGGLGAFGMRSHLQRRPNRLPRIAPI
jgi:hypothetical protein